MTRDEVLAMKPGPSLNLLVAEKVLGWIAWEEKRGEYTYVVFQRPGEHEPYRKMKGRETEKERYRKIPFSEIDRNKHIVAGEKDWSTDISAAWEVAEKVFDSLSFRIGREGYTVNESGMWECQIGGLNQSIKARTAPEAICKAALLAVMDL